MGHSRDFKRMFPSYALLSQPWEQLPNHMFLSLQGEVGCGQAAERSCSKDKPRGHGESWLVALPVSLQS